LSTALPLHISHREFEQFGMLAWAARERGELDRYSWHTLESFRPKIRSKVAPMMPVLTISDWVPDCVPGPRDAPVHVTRHLRHTFPLFVPPAVMDRIRQDDPERWAALDYRLNALQSDEDIDLLFFLGLCIQNPYVMGPPRDACQRALEHAAWPHLLSLLQNLNNPNVVNGSYACRIAVYLCDVTRAPGATYGVSRYSPSISGSRPARV